MRALWKLGPERRPASPSPMLLERVEERVTTERLIGAAGTGGWWMRTGAGGMRDDLSGFGADCWGVRSGGGGGSKGEKRRGADGCRSAVGLWVVASGGWMGAD